MKTHEMIKPGVPADGAMMRHLWEPVNHPFWLELRDYWENHEDYQAMIESYQPPAQANFAALKRTTLLEVWWLFKMAVRRVPSGFIRKDCQFQIDLIESALMDRDGWPHF